MQAGSGRAAEGASWFKSNRSSEPTAATNESKPRCQPKRVSSAPGSVAGSLTKASLRLTLRSTPDDVGRRRDESLMGEIALRAALHMLIGALRL